MTATLVAFTCSASAIEPVAMPSVVAGETIDIDSAVEKLRGAACALRAAKTIPMIPTRARSENGRCLINDFNTDLVEERLRFFGNPFGTPCVMEG